MERAQDIPRRRMDSRLAQMSSREARTQLVEGVRLEHELGFCLVTYSFSKHLWYADCIWLPQHKADFLLSLGEQVCGPGCQG